MSAANFVRRLKKLFANRYANHGDLILHTGDGNKPAFRSENNLCEKCRALDFANLFRTDARSPEPDGDYLKTINTLENIVLQKTCPFCRLLCYIVSSSPKTVKSAQSNSYNDPGEIYLEPQRADYALCGIDLDGKSIELPVASCLHVETGDYGFQAKIVLTPEVAGEIPQRPLYSLVNRLNSRIDFQAVRGWLEECSSIHQNTCLAEAVRVQDQAFRDSQRAIDVGTRKVVHVDLERVKFAALTYVWGNTPSPAIVRQDCELIPPSTREPAQDQLKDDMKGFEGTLSDPLPQTFEDALTVCSELSVRYLWIDAFCIDQTNEDDKKLQIYHMDFIYGAAYVTLVAIEGKDPTAGLPRVSAHVSSDIAGGSDTGFYVENIAGLQLAVIPGFVAPNTVWNTRAWTLQEILLSKRLLIFNSHGLSFYCRSCVRREDVQHIGSDKIQHTSWQGVPGSVITNDYYRSQFTMRRYCQLVNLYGSRDLSDPMDALNAVLGILNVWTHHGQMDFVLGLPSKYPTDTLVWQGSNHRLRGHKGLPTWTWISWQGHLRYSMVISENGVRTTEEFQRRYHFDLADFAHPLQSRLVSFYEPGSINFGTVIEQEALVEFPELSAGGIQLRVTSYVTRYRLPVMSRQEYSEWRNRQEHYNETLYDADGRPLNSMVLIQESNSLSVFSSPHGYAGLNMRLPEDIARSDEMKLRNEEAEFVMLKYWHYPQPRGKWERRRWKVWALMISRKAGTVAAQRLGCIAIPAEVWELGSPRLETIMLG